MAKIMDTDQSLGKLTPQATISQITAAHEKAGQLLSSIGLSLSKHEDETLQSVCQQYQWSEKEVLYWIQQNCASEIQKSSFANPNYKSDLKKWCSHLKNTFIEPNLSLLKELSQSFPRVHKIHGNQYPWIKNVEWQFKKFEEALKMYYSFEKKTFFPLTQDLSSDNKAKINHGTIQKIERAFSVITRDQKRLENQMIIIKEKSYHFESPPNACSTLRIQNKNFEVLFSGVEEQFEAERTCFISLIKEKIGEGV